MLCRVTNDGIRRRHPTQEPEPPPCTLVAAVSSAVARYRSELRVLFIAGAGRSGSTLLARLAGQCHDCVTVGELRHLGQSGAADSDPTRRCGCGEPFDVCPFWTSVMSDLVARGWDPQRQETVRGTVDRIRYIPKMLWAREDTDFRRRQREFTSYLADVYGLVSSRSGNSLVVDSSKDPSFLFLLLQNPDLDVDVIHLVRDPRAVAYSWTTRKRLPEVVGRTAYMRTYRAGRSAGFWLATNLLAEVGGRRARRYHRVRYEDFVNAPAQAVRGVVGSGAAETPFIDGNKVKFVKTEHLVKGNPDRFQSGWIEIAPDQRWESHLPAMQKLLVGALCFPLMVRYGYRWSAPNRGAASGL